MELLCVQIIQEDVYNLDSLLQEFCMAVGGNPYCHDEYTLCTDLKEAVEAKDWKKAKEVTGRPLFGFLEIEVVRPLRKWISVQKPVEVQVIKAETKKE